MTEITPEQARKMILSGQTTGDPMRDVIWGTLGFKGQHERQYERYKAMNAALEGKLNQLAVGRYEPFALPGKVRRAVGYIQEPQLIALRSDRIGGEKGITACMPFNRYFLESDILDRPARAIMPVHKLDVAPEKHPPFAEAKYGWFTARGDDLPDCDPPRRVALTRSIHWIAVGDEAVAAFFEAERGTGTVFDRQKPGGEERCRQLFDQLNYHGSLRSRF